MNFKRLLAAVAALVLFTTVLVACGDGTSTVQPATVGPKTTSVATTAAISTTSAAATSVAPTSQTTTVASLTTAASTTTAAASAASPNNQATLAALKKLGENLTATSDALKKNDVAAARTAFKKFDDGWSEVEDKVKEQSKDLYREIEDGITKVGRELLRTEKPVVADVTASLETLQQKYTAAIKAVEGAKSSANAPKVTPVSGAEVDAATNKVSEYLKGKSDALTKSTASFAAVVKARDIAKAKAGYEAARFDYESIEFLAEAFKDLDVAIDARPDDYPKGENDPAWTGFHPLEKAIYVDGKLDERTDRLAEKLVVDVNSLRDEIAKLKIEPDMAIGGAAELIEEIQAGKITGEEERYSHTDLNDFRANFLSAKFVYEAYAPFVKQRNATLDTEVRTQFSEVEKSIAPYFTNPAQVADYSKVDDKTRKALAQKVEALAETFSRVSGTLGLKI